jgi:hypothetical protein
VAAYSRCISAAMIPSRVTGDLLAGMYQLLSQFFGALSRRNLLCDNYSSIDQRRRLVAGARELVHGAELFIGGYRWQRSGLGVGSSARSVRGGGCSRVQSPMTTRAWVRNQKLRRCSHRAPEQTVVPFSCSVVMCGLLPC